MTSALSTLSDTFHDAGIVPATPTPEFSSVGISLDGKLYLYADEHQGQREVPALAGLVTSVSVATYGANSVHGPRDYLDVHIAASPVQIYVLRLPCHSGQWSYRSLLGCLLELDLPAVAVKIEPRRGRTATFIRVSLDPEGHDQVMAEAIGPDRDDLEMSVNRVRLNLGLDPQFP
jgi:hypothetical protein